MCWVGISGWTPVLHYSLRRSSLMGQFHDTFSRTRLRPLWLSLLLGQDLLPCSLHQCWSLLDPMVSQLRRWSQTQASHQGHGQYCTLPGMQRQSPELRTVLVLWTTNFPREKCDKELPKLGMQREKPPAGSSAQHTTTKRHDEGAVRGTET